jgi:FAD:protein FMN transferase
MFRYAYLLLVLTLFVACSKQVKVEKIEGSFSGRDWTIQVFSTPEERDSKQDLQAAAHLLQTLYDQISIENPDSDINKVNDLSGSRSGSMGRESYDLLMRAFRYKKESEESFEFLAGPLYRLWGFRDAKGPIDGELAQLNQSWPQKAEIDSVLELVHNGGTFVVDLGVLLAQKGMEIDIEHVIEGYVVDKVLAELRQQGYMNLEIKLGGVIRYAGMLPQNGQDFELKIPGAAAGQNSLGSIKLSDMAISYVSVAQNQHKIGNRVVHSMIDPKNGEPSKKALAAWVTHRLSAEKADAWSAALFFLGPQKGIELLEKQDGLEGAIYAEHEGKLQLLKTSGFKKFN